MSSFAATLAGSIGLALALTGCGPEPDAAEPSATPESVQLTTPDAVELNAELRDELLRMRDDDQADRTGEGEWSDDVRTARLKEIIDEYGWPTRTLVGDDGASAAWLIAQHSDFDPQFQQEALELMKAAVADGEADPIDVAYLEDRVAVSAYRPQTYGTQISCVDGEPKPREIADEDQVDERRAEVGLEPLADYLDELTEMCAAEQE